jgi:cytoskeleton protein RodZ
MPEDATSGVGAYLREARERAGISVRAVATATKISVPTLEALERDDVSRLPGGIFVRSFVRAYAREVGLDPDEAVRRLVTRFPDASVEESPTPYLANPEKIVVDDEPGAGRLWRIVGWSLPLVLIVVYFGFGGRLTWWRQSARTAAPRAEQQAEPVPAGSAPVLTTPIAAPPAAPSSAPGTEEPVAAGSPEPGAAAVPPGAAAAGPKPLPADAPQSPDAASAAAVGEGRFNLTLAPRARCWVTIRSDGKIVFAGTMKAGDRQDLVLGGEVSLTVGDAGAMDFAINGHPARSLGGEGQVATVRMNIGNLNTFLASR